MNTSPNIVTSVGEAVVRDKKGPVKEGYHGAKPPTLDVRGAM
jgi:hypothetical protein